MAQPTALGSWAVDLILLGLSDPDALVRQGFAWNAAKLSDPSAPVTSRLRVVAATDPDEQVRAAARWSLSPRDSASSGGPEWANYLPKRRGNDATWDQPVVLTRKEVGAAAGRRARPACGPRLPIRRGRADDRMAR